MLSLLNTVHYRPLRHCKKQIKKHFQFVISICGPIHFYQKTEVLTVLIFNIELISSVKVYLPTFISVKIR